VLLLFVAFLDTTRRQAGNHNTSLGSYHVARAAHSQTIVKCVQ